MEERIVRKLEGLNIHAELQKAGINHQRLAVSNLLASFMQLVADWRSDPRRFKKNLTKLRDKALEPYLEDPDTYAEDITLINLTYSHLVAYTMNEIDPVIEDYLQYKFYRLFL